MEITQKERLDLTDKQVREEYLAYTTSAIEKTLGILSTGKTIEDLKAENQRLKAQLDREIKINRKMKNALKEYASPLNWHEKMVWQRPEDTDYEGGFDGERLAQQTLNEVGEEE